MSFTQLVTKIDGSKFSREKILDGSLAVSVVVGSGNVINSLRWKRYKVKLS